MISARAVAACVVIAVLTTAGCEPEPAPSATIEPSAGAGALIATTPALPWAARRANGFLAQLCAPPRDATVARFDLCYELTALAPMAGAGGDRFLLHVYGSIVADDGPGIRAWRVAVVPAADQGGRIVGTWPRGSYDAPCQTVGADLPGIAGVLADERICPSTLVTTTVDRTSILWSCPDCPPPRRATLGVSLYVLAELPARGLPSWEIRADLVP